jgi:hypothetical protein
VGDGACFRVQEDARVLQSGVEWGGLPYPEWGDCRKGGEGGGRERERGWRERETRERAREEEVGEGKRGLETNAYLARTSAILEGD